MSRIGVVSDIHANLPAFEAVLEDLDGEVEEIFCLGDIVGICGFPSEVIDLVQSSCSQVLKGNHDIAMFLGELESEVISVEQSLFFDEVDESQQSWLYKLDTLQTVTTPSDDEFDSFVLAHSYPFEGESSGVENGNAGVFPREMVSVGSEFEDSVILLGHTHSQHSIDLKKFGHNVIVMNPGSVGGVYQDVAEYAIIDTNAREVELKSVEYDKAPVIQRIGDLESKYDTMLFD